VTGVKKCHLLVSLRLLFVFSLAGSSQVVHSTASAQSYLFNKAEFSAGINPVSVAAGDFNNDGRIDLAVANRNCPNSICGNSSLSVLLGKPDGTFETPVDYPLGGNSIDLAVIAADLNGDGILDLAVASGGGVTIFVGKGDGTFQLSGQFFTGNDASSLAAGDFNGDGKLDLAVANSTDSAVSILLGNGDGTFQSPVNYTAGFITSSVITADFNGDGKLDLAVVNRQGNTVSILLGNGDGTFRAHVDYATGNFPQSVTAGDFNGDGKVDLAVANNNFGSNGSVSVLLGNGDGTFQAHLDYPTAGGAFSVVTGDFNGDASVDLAVTDGGFGNGLSVLLGKGDGTFQAAVRYVSGSGAEGLTTADVNGDGTSDLVVTNQIDNTLTVLLGNGDGTFLSKHDYATVPTSVSVSTADFNRDGKLDLAVTNVDSSSISVLLGNGDGTFQPRVDYPTGNHPFSGGVGDFNGDGKLDLVTANAGANSMSILLGNGDGTFGVHADFATGTTPFSLVAGDFNGDGKLDVAVADRDSNAVSILLGNGDGTFQPRVDSPTGFAPLSVAAADLNGDGKLDLAIVNSQSDTVSILLGKGDGTFQPRVDYALPPPFSPAAITIADFNGDHRLDLAVGTPTGVSVFLGNGDGTFQPHVDYVTPFSPTSISAGDFNGDGKADLAVADSVVSILLGNGNGGFGNHTDYATPFSANGVTSGDFTGAGGLDLAVTSASFVSVFLDTSVAALFPNKLSFSSQAVGTTSGAKTVLLSNAGGVPLKVSSVAASGGFAQTNNCPVSPAALAPAASCTISVTFTPATTGTLTGSLVITDSVLHNPQVVPLTGNLPAFGLSATNLNYGSQLVGTTSAVQTVTLHNPGNMAINVNEIEVGGPNSRDFAESNTCGGTLAASAMCTISVTFTPSSRGSRTAKVNIFDDASNSPQTLGLSGTGIAPVVSLSVPALTFANEPVNTPSGAQQFMLSNIGDAPLTVASIAASGDFAQTNNCGTTVGIGANCTVNVTFTPTLSGIRNGAVTITDNAADSSQMVTLTGMGVAPVVSLPGASFAFGSQAVGTRSLTQSMLLTNIGNGSLSLTSIAITGGESGDFSETTTCGTGVAAGANCAISVTFTPTVAGNRSATLTITDNASDSPQSVSLTGTGTDFSLALATGANCPSGGNCSTSAIITAGQTATYNLQVSAVNGFSGSISLICTGAPGPSTCSISPASVVPSGPSFAFTVTINNTANVMTPLPLMDSPGMRQPPIGFGISLLWAFVLALLVGCMRIVAGQPKRLAYPTLVLLLVSLVYVSGCGGGGSSGGNAGTPIRPPTNATMTVTASSAGVSRTLALSLTVNH
jgi:hypothetical protein